MKESTSFPSLVNPQRNSSIRLRKRGDGVKKQLWKNRGSGDFGHSLSSDAVNSTDNMLANSKVGTLDPGPVSAGIQQNLRPLLRKKYRKAF